MESVIRRGVRSATAPPTRLL